jgi:hypothetical protein
MRQRKTLVYGEKQSRRGDVFERLHSPKLLRLEHGGKPNREFLEPKCVNSGAQMGFIAAIVRDRIYNGNWLKMGH